MLGEKEVLVSDFSYPTLMFIKDILKKRQLGELTEGALALKVEVVIESFMPIINFSILMTTLLLPLSFESYMSYLKSQILTFSIKE